jgi:5-bromo-4-chloroindolyl phosphate hydrolysis protein
MTMTNNNQETASHRSVDSIYKQKASREELREIEERVDRMLEIAWSVYRTIAKDPAKLAELRRHLTEWRRLDPMAKRSNRVTIKEE